MLPVAVMTAVVVSGRPADEEPGEENHRDDEHDTGDNAYPGQDLVQPIRAAISVIVIARRGPGFKCFGHVPIMPPPIDAFSQ